MGRMVQHPKQLLNERGNLFRGSDRTDKPERRRAT